MSVSLEIKEFLINDIERRKDCCKESFDKGRKGEIYKERCPACRSSFVGGVFVGFGSVTDPEKAFHLDMRLSVPLADKLCAMLTEESIEPHRHSLKGGKERIYYKISSAIGDFLTYIGATRFALTVMEKEVYNSVKFKENREANAVIANLDRLATAAAEQMLSISALKKSGVLESLPEELKETARLREANPDMSLAELCQQFNPPISKSGLNHRLKRLNEEAKKIKEQ